MAEQYSVEAVLSVIDQGFTQAMQKADAMTDKLTNSSNNSAGGIGRMAASFGIGQIAANMATSAVRALGSAVGTITGEMNDNAKAWKTFEGNMTMIGKSESEINNVRSSLQDFATQTIYSASDMASTYGQMAAIGVADTEKLVRGMGGLAASAENPAQAMKSMSQQMVQAMAQPELKWQDFRIMMDQAPAGMAQVAQEMGYSLDELIVAIQDGEVASKDFAVAMATVGTNDHFSQLATTAMTVDQAVDGLTETLANKLEPAFNLATDMGINAIEGFTDWIDAVDFSPMISGLETVAGLFGVIAPEVETMTNTVAMSAEEIDDLSTGWEGMTLTDKQAQIETMGQDDVEALMNLLGVDFENLPNEYHKDAYVNAFGVDGLEEVLFLTGEWANLTFEEKRAVLETQIDNEELAEAIETRDLWNNEEFYGQLADIDMDDDNAEQQVLDLINTWGELEGLDPIEMEVDAKQVESIPDTINKSKIAIRQLSTVGKLSFDKISTFIEPITAGLGDMNEILGDFGIGLDDTFKYIDEGDWEGAWESFKDVSGEAFDSVGDTAIRVVDGMWKNIKQTGADLGTWFSDIDWGGVYSEVDGFFGAIGDQIMKVDWRLVAGEVGGTVADFVSGTKAWLEENVPKGVDFIQEVLLNPESQLNKDAGEFHGEVMALIDGFIEGLGIKEYVMDWVINVNAKPFFSWGSWQDEIDHIMSIFENENYDQSVFLDISIQRSQGRDETEVQQIIDDMYGEGTYETHLEVMVEAEHIVRPDKDWKNYFNENPIEPVEAEIDVEATPNIEVEDSTSWLDEISNIFKGKNVSAQVDIQPAASAGASSQTASATGGGTAPSIDYSELIAATTSAMEAINQSTQSGMQRNVEAVRQGGSQMVMAMLTSGNSMINTSQSISNQVLAVFNGMQSRMFGAGFNAGSGFNQGLASQRSNIISTAQSIANSVSNTINDALDMASPSKLLHQSGAWAIEGMVLGMESMLTDVMSVSNDVALAAIPDIPNLPLPDVDYGSYGGVSRNLMEHTFTQQSNSNSCLEAKLDEVIQAIENGQIIMLEGRQVSKATSRFDNRNLGKSLEREAYTR